MQVYKRVYKESKGERERAKKKLKSRKIISTRLPSHAWNFIFVIVYFNTLTWFLAILAHAGRDNVLRLFKLYYIFKRSSIQQRNNSLLDFLITFQFRSSKIIWQVPWEVTLKKICNWYFLFARFERVLTLLFLKQIQLYACREKYVSMSSSELGIYPDTSRTITSGWYFFMRRNNQVGVKLQIFIP